MNHEQNDTDPNTASSDKTTAALVATVVRYIAQSLTEVADEIDGRSHQEPQDPTRII
jgi:hypothetical protein